MNKVQIQAEYLELLKRKIDEEDELIEAAKERGIWKEGLDSNQEFFVELNAKFAKQVETLKSKIELDGE